MYLSRVTNLWLHISYQKVIYLNFDSYILLGGNYPLAFPCTSLNIMIHFHIFVQFAVSNNIIGSTVITDIMMLESKSLKSQSFSIISFKLQICIPEWLLEHRSENNSEQTLDVWKEHNRTFTSHIQHHLEIANFLENLCHLP